MQTRFSNNSKFNKKKLFLVIILLMLALISTIEIKSFAVAQDDQNIEANLNDSVFDIVDDLDLSGLENIISDVEDFNIFNTSISEKLNQILKGEYFTNYSSVITGILSFIFVDIKEIIPFVLTLIAIGVLSSMMLNFKSEKSNTSDIISFVFLSVAIIIILIAFKNILNITNGIFSSISNQMQIIFPILITLLTSIGSFTTISIYNPLVAVLTTGVTFVFDKLLYPIFITIFLLTILGSLTKTIKVNKLTGFLNSSFKWIIGIVFTLFTGFLSIQGISAGKFDSVSIKTTKFAMKSYIPIIGSYISEGIDFFILGSVLVKNAIGLIGVIILFVTIISPIISILIYKLALQLCGGVLDLCGENKFAEFFSNCSKILILPIVLILGVSFMYIITICLIMCTANIF